MKKLPIGIQTFTKIIEDNGLYVDKTQLIVELIQAGDFLFLSRPRRFGKSLLISTLEQIFTGNQDLFKGLAIYDQIEWQAYPIIHIDFAAIDFSDEISLQTGLIWCMDEINEKYQLNLETKGFKTYFSKIIKALYEKYGKVVILIDEYDKPIVDYINDVETATQNRAILRNFFGVLKASDRYLRFVFITGISKFSRVSLFSELNNLRDITLSSQFATLLGYTQIELETYFADYIQRSCTELALDKTELLTKIKSWYNGYSWDAKNQVYNPFSILNFFAEQRFSNYWFSSGTPKFLIQLIKHNAYDVTHLEQSSIPEIVFESYDIETMNVFALLFQTGYLTITAINRDSRTISYELGYPNFEVREAFVTFLFESFTKTRLERIQPAANALIDYLDAENLDGFMQVMRSLFAKIPYPLHLEQEAYYHSLFYMIAVLMGVEIDLEVLTDKGQIDGILTLPDKIYVLEFKYGKAGTAMATLTQKAIQQIRDKNYADRFLNDTRPRWLLGVGFVEKELGYQLIKA